MTYTDRLRQELQALRAGFEANGRGAADSTRMDAIRLELNKRARRRVVARARREIMFDLLGHHSRA